MKCILFVIKCFELSAFWVRRFCVVSFGGVQSSKGQDAETRQFGNFENRAKKYPKHQFYQVLLLVLKNNSKLMFNNRGKPNLLIVSFGNVFTSKIFQHIIKVEQIFLLLFQYSMAIKYCNTLKIWI